MIFGQQFRFLFTIGLLVVSCGTAAGITLNQVDSFQGSTDNWARGTEINDGGPTGTGDGFLQVSSGSFGGRSKLITFNQSQWTGDYVAAGVCSVSMSLKNFGSSALPIRITIRDQTGGQTTPGYSSTNPLMLPADGQWHTAQFNLTAADMTAVNPFGGTLDPFSVVLANVADFRLLSATAPAIVGDAISAQIGVDEITALPPPNSTWTGASSTSWSDTGNWTGAVPGATSGASNTDTATFSQNAAHSPLVVDAARNVQNITFDTANVNSLTVGAVGGNPLLLTAGGTIQTTVTVVNAQTINAPLMLEGSYTFANSSTNAGVLLDFGGAITTAANPLTLSGAGNILISGRISGAGSINKTGSGTVYLTGANSYSGGTTVTSGILITNTLGDPTSPIVVSAAAGVNSALVLGASQQGQTIGSLQGTVAPSGSAVVSISGNDVLTIDQATNTSFGGTVWNSGTLIKSGAGTLEITGTPTLSDLSSIQVTGGGLRLNVASGSPSIGSGVVATVSSGATLELAGSVSAVANGPNRVNITNNSSAPGILVSGTNQQVGSIDGSGTTQVNAGSDLTANHIIQGALVIGGTSKNPGLVTIDASDASGNPLASLAVLGGPASATSLGAGSNLADPLGDTTNSDPIADAPPFDSSVTAAPAVVPEPSSLFLLAAGGLAFGLTAYRKRSRLLNWKNRSSAG